MKGEIISVELPRSRDALLITVKIERPIFPKDYTDQKEADQYMQDVKAWQGIHTGLIDFDYAPLF